jgi:nitrogen fixation/metabolism regulation signal transduction histidine kinase
MSTQKRKITLKKLSALNTVWHPESGLVFKSQKERLVIGSYVGGNLVDLDDEALTLCEEWNFKPDESLLEADAEEEAEEAEEAEEEDKEDADEKEEDDEREESLDGGKEETKDESREVNTEALPNTDKLIEEITKHLEEKLQPACIVLQTRIDEHLATIHSRDKTIEDHRKTIEENQKELAELKAKHDAIQKKFDAMKSLFN